MPISSPATGLPATRWLSISLRVRLLPIDLLCPPGAITLAPGVSGQPAGSPTPKRRERSALGADVVAARANEPVVGVLLDDVGRPARDARGGDHRREEVDRDAERVEEWRRVEVDVRD